MGRLETQPAMGWLLVLLGAIAAIAPLAIDMYLPALPAIGDTLNASDSQVQLSLALFMFGFALCQLIYGPLSDRFGRRPILLFGLALFTGASVACAFAINVEQLLFARLVQAFGGGASAVVINAMVRDLYRGPAAARAFSLVIMAMTLAPLVAPTVGGLLLEYYGWRSIFLVLALLGCLLTLIVMTRLPETLAEQRRQQPGWHTLARSYQHVASHRQAMGNLLCSALAFGGMFAFITGSPFVYIEYFAVDESLFGLLFGGNILVLMLANWINSRLVMTTGLRPLIVGAVTAQAIIGGILLAITIAEGASIALVATCCALYIGLIGLVAPNTSAAVVSPFEKHAGSAAALLGMSRFVSGGIASLLVALLQQGSLLAMVSVMATFALGALAVYLLMVKPDPTDVMVSDRQPTSD